MNIFSIKKILFALMMSALLLSVNTTPVLADDDKDAQQQDIEDDVEDDVEKDVEDDVEKDVEDEAEGDIEKDVEDEAEDNAANDAENDSEDDADNITARAKKATPNQAAKHARLAQKDKSANRVERIIILAKEYDNAKIYTDDWLILNDPGDDDFLASKGYQLVSKAFLPSLQKNLIRVEAPASFRFNQAGKQRFTQLNTPDRAVDFNHVYEISNAIKPAQSGSLIPGKLIRLAPLKKRQKVGIIDTRINPAHPALVSARIVSQEFAEQTPSSGGSHANSVASILLGNSGEYQGLLSKLDVFAASVFFSDRQAGDVTTTESLIKALDWLVKQEVTVINMSLAGPPNRLLAQVIGNYCSKGVIVVAAVGNNGPNSKPLFPAAYDCVVGVTAISNKQRIYRRAVRGQQVDVASYGVNVLAADSDKGYKKVTGTSFATPFVTAYIVSRLDNKTQPLKNKQPWLDSIFSNMKDLGAPGKDSVYGFGALTKDVVEHQN